MSILPKALDERFFAYRLRSTSIAGMIGAAVAIGLFYYRYYFDHFWSWDLLAVGLTFVGVKVAVMAWYFLNH
jgi:hypothetical protein